MRHRVGALRAGAADLQRRASAAVTTLALAFDVLVIAALADVLTTRAGIRSGAFLEANPLMRPFVRTTPRAMTAKVAGVLVIAWGVFDLAVEWPRLALVVTLGAAAVNAWHAWRNWQLYRAWKRWRGADSRMDAMRYVAMAPTPADADEHSPIVDDAFAEARRRARMDVADGMQRRLEREIIGDTEDDIAELRRVAREVGEELPTVDATRDYLDALEARRLTGCL